MSVQVIHTGFYTTIQDSGRTGYRHWGVPVSGPMDRESFALANALLDNSETAAVLECTISGPTLLFNAPTRVAVAGGPIEIRLNGVEVEMCKAIDCDLGTILEFGKITKGVRSYIAFEGGLATPKTLGSRSQYFPVTEYKKLQKGMVLPLRPHTTALPKIMQVPSTNWIGTTETLNVLKGPDWGRISEQHQTQLLSEKFSIGSNDRMGYQLKGALSKNNYGLPSSFVLPGTVQLTPEGTLLVAMADGQVTGGYPRVFMLSGNEVSKLAQLRTGKTIRFEGCD